MTITVNFNNKSFQLSSLPPNLPGLKKEIHQLYSNELYSDNFSLRFNFINNLRKRQHSNVETEAQYHFLPRLMGNVTSDISIDVVPQFSSKELRDVVIIEDERSHKKSYVNFGGHKEMPRQSVPLNPKKPSFTPAQSTTKNLVDKSHTDEPKKAKATKIEAEDAHTHNHQHHHHHHQNRASVGQPRMDPTDWRHPTETNYRCDNCAESIGNVRYHSTGAKDYDLCSDCVLRVQHPYSLIEYINGKPIREVVGPKAPRASMGPRYGGHSHGYNPRPNNFSSMFGSGFGRGFDDMFHGFN